jgi:hypothetical protein
MVMLAVVGSHPGTESGQCGRGRQGEPQQSQDHAPDHRKRGYLSGGQRHVLVLVPGDHPAADHDQRVTGKGVGHRGIVQTAKLRQPGAAAMMFMNTRAPTDATFSARARSARRPRSARQRQGRRTPRLPCRGSRPQLRPRRPGGGRRRSSGTGQRSSPRLRRRPTRKVLWRRCEARWPTGRAREPHQSFGGLWRYPDPLSVGTTVRSG